MGYLQEVDAWLSDILSPLSPEDRERAVKGIKIKILESYRNGAKRCPNCHGQKDSGRAPFKRRYRSSH